MAVTVTANSTPTGAMVLRPTGEVLGTTPLVSQIQIPANQIGLPQTFTFNLAGHQPTTATAVAQNNAITVQTSLQSLSGNSGSSGTSGRTLTVRSRGGGRISDFRTTSARATVTESCTIQEMRVRVRGRHSYHGDLVVSLRGPSGQTAVLQRRRSANPFRRYRINRMVGTQALGQWTLRIRDELRADSGVLSGFTMEITCQ